MALYTPEQWRSLIEDYEASGITQAEFCKQHNLNPKYFSLKRSKLQPHTRTASPFVQAARVPENAPGSELELQVGAVKLTLFSVGLS